MWNTGIDGECGTSSKVQTKQKLVLEQHSINLAVVLLNVPQTTPAKGTLVAPGRR